MQATSSSWDGEKVILCDRALEVRIVDGRLRIARKPRASTSGTPMSRLTIRMARGASVIDDAGDQFADD
jgi:hypothetical protein